MHSPALRLGMVLAAFALGACHKNAETSVAATTASSTAAKAAAKFALRSLSFTS
jgi:hypothetical protein